ncbi:putative diacylglycerol kinase [Cryptosporidium felis]|nr:putative diacylglycerol kinase [Cryptosporidium felis]
MEQKKPGKVPQTCGGLRNNSVVGEDECEKCSRSTAISCFREYIGNPLAFIYLFYNKLSGGNIETYFSKYLKEITLDVDGIATHINFVDIISDLDSGIQRVNNSLKITNKDICIIGVGGDGSFSTLVNAFLESIPDKKKRLIFAVLPFGTGNDWARSFGWSSYGNLKFMKDDFSPLIDLARGIFTSNVENFDTWTVEVEITGQETSSFQRVSPTTHELEQINDSEGNKLLRLKKRCLNYFSFGEESRVGITFDTYRKKNVILNRALYGLAGSVFSVSMANKHQSNIPLSHSTRTVYLVDKDLSEKEENKQKCGLCPNVVEHHSQGAEKELICPTLQNSVSLVFLNIETFGGGVQLWRNSKNLGPSISKKSSNINFGEMVGNLSSLILSPVSLEVERNRIQNGEDDRSEDSAQDLSSVSDSEFEDENEEDAHYEDNSIGTCLGGDSQINTARNDLLNVVTNPCDRKLEIMSFSGLLDFSSIFLPYMSTAKRVAQFCPFEGIKSPVENVLSTTTDNGSDSEMTQNLQEEMNLEQSHEISRSGKTLKILFNNASEETKVQENPIELYFQIDGEYYFAIEPKHCTVKYDQQIRILHCIIPYTPFNSMH